MTIRFSDGEMFDVSGPLHTEERKDGWYVVGDGHLIPCASREAGEQIIREMKGEDAKEGGAE